MEKIKFNAQLLLSFSLFCLAMAIGYFAFEMHQFLKGFPAILVQMEKTAGEIGPVVNDIADTSRNILPISENLVQVAKGLPAAIEEIRAIRKSLPETLDKTIVIAEKIEKTSQTLPEVLEEVRQTRQLMPDAIKKIGDVETKIPLILDEMKKYREELPKIRESMGQAAAAVAGITKEMAEIRPLIPGILAEVEQTRKAIPDMLDQAERIASKGEDFGTGAGRGAVSGFINLFNPLVISAQLKELVLPGRNAQELTPEDIRLIRETTLEIVKTGAAGAEMKWKNPESRNEGTMSVVRQFDENTVACKELRTKIWIKKDKTHDFNVIFCRQTDGAWIEKGKPVSNK
ncbi:MAG: hypothetical protein WA081_07855 [Desulfosalsimonadaceae bacterium]